LPDVLPLERNGFQPQSSYGGAFVALRQQVVEPPGECRSVFEVEYEVAQKLGLDQLYPWKTTEEWIDHKLKPSGIDFNHLKDNPITYLTPPLGYRKYMQEGFKTPSGKVEFSSQELKAMGHNALPEYREPEAVLDSRYSLIGTSRKPGGYVHTQFRNLPSLRKREPDTRVRIHPQDADKRGILDGGFATVESPQGRIRLKAMVTEETQPGLVIVDFGWGNPGDGGVNVNVLTSDANRDPLTGTTPNRRFVCEVVSD
jgi:anaerobic selenocysteine-containing dehydrogenase